MSKKSLFRNAQWIIIIHNLNWSLDKNMCLSYCMSRKSHTVFRYKIDKTSWTYSSSCPYTSNKRLEKFCCETFGKFVPVVSFLYRPVVQDGTGRFPPNHYFLNMIVVSSLHLKGLESCIYFYLPKIRFLWIIFKISETLDLLTTCDFH